MRCTWCDSEYTFTGGEHISIEDVLNQVRSFGCPLVEVTGGEPLAQPEAFDLVRRLCDEDYEVLIETGGYVSTENLDQRARVILDVKCPASGEAERNHWPNLSRLRPEVDEVKFVVADRSDWDFAAKSCRGLWPRKPRQIDSDFARLGPNRFAGSGKLDRRKPSEFENAVTNAQVHLGS